MEDLQDKIIELMDLFDGEVTTADKIDRPQQALDREMFQNAFKSDRTEKAGGGRIGFLKGRLVQRGPNTGKYAVTYKKTVGLNKKENVTDYFDNEELANKFIAEREKRHGGKRKGAGAKFKFGKKITLTENQIKKIQNNLPDGITLRTDLPGNPIYVLSKSDGRKNSIKKSVSMTNKNYLKDEGLDLLKTDLDNFMNTYLPNRLTEEKFEQLRYLDENINLTQEEFAKKLNNLGYRSYGEVPFTQRSVGRLDQKIGNIKRKSYTLAEQTQFLKNSLDPNEFKAIKDLNLPKDQEESLIRKRANSIRSRDARLNERGVFARGNSREAKLFANFYRAHTTSNRILIGGEFNGKDLSKRKNWPRDANGNVDWGAKGPDGKPAWKSVVFTDTQTPKGPVKFTFDNLKNQVDDAFGSGHFTRSTTAYVTQTQAYKEYGGRDIAKKNIIAEYKKKYKGATPSDAYIEARITSEAPGQVHHWAEGGIGADPYKVQFVSKSANQAVGKAELTYNKELRAAKNNPELIKIAQDKFKKTINQISNEMGGIKYTVGGQIIGKASTVESAYGFELNKNQVDDLLLKLSAQIDSDCAGAIKQASKDGGRIGLKTVGSPAFCKTKARNYMSQELIKGIGTQQNAKTSLIKRIIAGSANFLKQNLSPKELLKMENLIGKPALYGAVAFETGFVADDVFRKGKPLNVAAAESLFGTVLNLDADAAKAKNLLESNVQLSPAAKEYAQNIIDYDRYRKNTLSFPSSLIAKSMPGSDKYFKMQEDLKNKIMTTPDTGALDYQSALTESEAIFKAKPKELFGFEIDSPDAPEVTPLTNKFAQPPGRRVGPMTSKQDMKIDLTPITYKNFQPNIPSKEELEEGLRNIGMIGQDEIITDEAYQQKFYRPEEFSQLFQLPSFTGANQRFEKGGRAGFREGTPQSVLRKGLLKLIDDSVKSTPKDTTSALDKLIKKTLDEDLFDKKDRIVDSINISEAKKRKNFPYNQQVFEEPKNLDFYRAIKESNFRTKTGPYFDRIRRNKAGGGLLKQAGDRSGPPPESGPMSQGLQGLLKRGMKI